MSNFSLSKGLAADLREDVRRVGIAEPCSLIYRLARRLAENRERRRQCVDAFSLGSPSHSGRATMPNARYRLDPTFGGTAERRDPLGEQIDKLFGGIGWATG
jgi:hypothetical protein